MEAVVKDNSLHYQVSGKLHYVVSEGPDYKAESIPLQYRVDEE